jgi:hypothetical protein
LSVTSFATTVEARDNLAEILNIVYYGNEAVGIKRREKVIAIVVPVSVHARLARATVDGEPVSWADIDTDPKDRPSKKARKTKHPVNRRSIAPPSTRDPKE